ncbi:MAG TPA: hypothetical protein VGI82_03770 [Chitinophagaceae bacterium]
MKRYLIILTLILSGPASFAQDDNNGEKGGKIRDRMIEYIQDKLGLSKNESEKFTPVFVRYFKEFRQIRQQNKDLNKGDILELQKQIIDLRIRYRGEFKQIMDEQRANKVFVYEDEFRKKAIQILEIRKDRLGDKRLQRNRSLLQ